MRFLCLQINPIISDFRGAQAKSKSPIAFRNLCLKSTCQSHPLEVQPPCFIGWFPSFTIILVGIYHLPKGTTIFEMVVDFQGTCQWPWLKQEGATTIMLRSLPSSTTPASLMRMLGSSFVGSYDFLYLPRCSRQRHRIVEMAFINFVDHAFARLAVQLFREAAAIPSWSRTRVSQARIQGWFFFVGRWMDLN